MGRKSIWGDILQTFSLQTLEHLNGLKFLPIAELCLSMTDNEPKWTHFVFGKSFDRIDDGIESKRGKQSYWPIWMNPTFLNRHVSLSMWNITQQQTLFWLILNLNCVSHKKWLCKMENKSYQWRFCGKYGGLDFCLTSSLPSPSITSWLVIWSRGCWAKNV